jgi:hypothetical protein
MPPATTAYGTTGASTAGTVTVSSTFYAPLGTTTAPTTGIGSATFTRNTNATYLDASGVVQTAGSDVARIGAYSEDGSFGPAFLSELDSANSALWARDWTNAAWVKSTATAAKDQTGRDGAANAASSMLATAGNATALQSVTATSASYVFSVDVKRLTGTGNIDLTLDGGSTWTTKAVANDAAWHRIYIQQTLANPNFGIRLVTNGDKIAVDYGQAERGYVPAVPSSRIATTTAAVFRNEDVLTYSTSNISNTTGTTAATIYVPYAYASNGGVISTDSGGSGRSPYLGNASMQFLSYNGTDNPADGSLSAVTSTKIVFSWGAAGLKFYKDGGAPSTSSFTAGTQGNGTQFRVGGYSSTPLCGLIKEVKTWKRQLTDGEAQAY